VGGLDAVGVSSIFGLVRGTGTVTEVLPTFVLVSRKHLATRYRDNVTSFRAVSSSRLETMVGGSLRGLIVSTWVSVGRQSPLGPALTHRIRVMDGCVVWVRWVPH